MATRDFAVFDSDNHVALGTGPRHSRDAPGLTTIARRPSGTPRRHSRGGRSSRVVLRVAAGRARGQAAGASVRGRSGPGFSVFPCP